MKGFIDHDFLLNTETAKALYHDYAASMPIIDYHCHVSPAEIAENRRFDNIAQVWLGGDHYKWRLIRANGMEEKFVTGAEGSDYEKFMAFARMLPKAAGNPVYQWTHLELKRYFGCDLIIKPETADEIWKLCNEKLAGDRLTVRGIINQSNVKVIATTDDPADSLEWHKAIAEDSSFSTKVVPAFRPDKAIHIEKPEFAAYMEKLGTAAGIVIKTPEDLFAALENRIAFFDQMGCRASDHGLARIPFAGGSEDISAVFQKALSGEALSEEESERYKAAVMLFLGRQYAKYGWVMQLHYNALRNANTVLFNRLGPDIGNDAIDSHDPARRIVSLLDRLEQSGELPKTVLYSLNANDFAILDAIAGCFPGIGIVSKVQHGSAWWYNDTKPGMEAQLSGLANRGLLGGFIGMLTDSRSFLSYTRHEYFRRILCNLLGDWVENGEYPNDRETLGAIVQDISYNNAASFFKFKD